MRATTISRVFLPKRQEPKSIQSIKIQAVSRRRGAVQPFWVYASGVLIALNAALMFSYLLGVNAQAATGYEIQKIQDKVQTLTEANRQLNLKVSQITSIAEIQTDFLNSGYVPVSQVSYLQVNRYTER